MANEVLVQEADFDVGALQAQLCAGELSTGALVTFTGLVRAGNDSLQVSSMELEHYPGMTERSIQGIVDEAQQRWNTLAVKVIHRVGHLQPGEQIVYVGVSSPHRGDAFAACEFIMDYLKTRAPFWKKEHGSQGARWVDARESDSTAAGRWD